MATKLPRPLHKLAKRLLQRVGLTTPTRPARAQHVASPQSLRDHQALFEREVIEAAPGVHVAVGFGLANAILLEGDDGVVIIDSMESEPAAKEVKTAFNAITSKPVKALIYTHNHADHIFGGHVMAGDDNPEVYSHATTPELIRRIMSVIRPTISRRSMRQFGVMLSPQDRIGCGIGPELRYDPQASPSILWPTKTFEERLELTVAGLDLVLLHTPGETPDQIAIWKPQDKVLMPADNIYQSFPNLYAIRGTAYRDVMAWVRTLDTLRSLGAEHLVPSHTRPLHGKARIAAALQNYRDAIQFVHDQTIQGINKGMSVDELVQHVQLPAHLAEDPWLHEHYGRVDWSVRAIYQGYLGWFEEDAAFLSPMSALERAHKTAKLAGGVQNLHQQARKAANDGDWRWTLELTSHLLAINPDDEAAKTLRAQGLQGMASAETSANGRNYLLTQALETQGELTIPEPDPAVAARNIIGDMPAAMVMKAMPVQLRAQKCLDMTQSMTLHLSDTQEDFTLHVRRGVAQLEMADHPSADIRVSTTSIIWKEMLIGTRNPAVTLAGSGVSITKGNVASLARFLLLFKKA